MDMVEHALKLAARGFRVFPLKSNSKDPPLIKDFPNQATIDADQIRKWWKHWPTANVGISTNGLVVLDVDTKPGRVGAESLAALTRDGFDLPPTATQITATGGYHYIYLSPSPVSNSASKVGKDLDVRGEGGFLVGAGSHIGTKEYTINLLQPVVAPQCLIDRCAMAVPKTSTIKEPAIKTDPEQARERAVAYLNGLDPITEGGRNDTGYRVANQLKDFGLDKTEVFLTMNDYWKCEPMLEWAELKHIIDSAFHYGHSAQGSASPEAIFETPPPEEEPGTGPIQEMNESYAFVTTGGKYHILHETTDQHEKFKLDHLNEDTFHKKLAARTIQVAGEVLPMTKFWMRHPRRRSYDGIIFSPGRPPDPRFYNLWNGFAVKPLELNEEPTPDMKKAVKLFQEHIMENICDGNIGQYAWVMGWIAHLIQYPGIKPDTALVLRGRKGVGKTVVFEILRRFLPANFILTPSIRNLTGNFNAHLEKCSLFVLEEAVWGGDKTADAILKHMITGKDAQIEKKGIDSYTVDSSVRVVILGNENWVIPATHDERRFAVFNVKEGRRKDREFFGQLVDLMAAGGERYLMTLLLKYDLTKVDVFSAPMTQGLKDQKEQSLDVVGQWWSDSLDQGYIEGVNHQDFEDGSWLEKIDKNQFRTAFTQYARNRGIAKWMPTDRGLLQAIQGFLPIAKFGKKDDSKLQQIILAPLDECKRYWDRYQNGE